MMFTAGVSSRKSQSSMMFFPSSVMTFFMGEGESEEMNIG